MWRTSTGVYTVYLTRFRIQKIVLPPKTKTWVGGGGAQTDQHLPPNPFTGQFENTTLGFEVFIVIWSTRDLLDLEKFS